MGVAIDTVALDVHNTATSAVGLTAAVAASGDSLSVRNFTGGAAAYLQNVYLQGASAPRRFRLLSARLHDNVTGISFDALESPTEFLLPPEIDQPLYAGDTLVAQMDAAASSDTVAALLNYYTDLPGISANLYTWAQLKGRVIDFKPVEVDVTSSATIGQWSDTLLTTTENQLKADYEYAVLGVEGTAAFCAVGVKGAATGNLRVCAPGSSPTLRLTDYFVYMSQENGIPFIPVFSANDRTAFYVSVLANTASAADNVFLILARLG